MIINFIIECDLCKKRSADTQESLENWINFAHQTHSLSGLNDCKHICVDCSMDIVKKRKEILDKLNKQLKRTRKERAKK